jgi:hypothetical protein
VLLGAEMRLILKVVPSILIRESMSSPPIILPGRRGQAALSSRESVPSVTPSFRVRVACIRVPRRLQTRMNAVLRAYVEARKRAGR